MNYPEDIAQYQHNLETSKEPCMNCGGKEYADELIEHDDGRYYCEWCIKHLGDW